MLSKSIDVRSHLGVLTSISTNVFNSTRFADMNLMRSQFEMMERDLEDALGLMEDIDQREIANGYRSYLHNIIIEVLR